MKISLAFAASTLAVIALGCGKATESAARPESHSVRADVVTVQLADTTDEFAATGTVRSLYNATLSSKVMGRVVSVSGRAGDTVRKGQVLVALDPRELEAGVAMAEANYRAGLVGVMNARTAADMESKTGQAGIDNALAQVDQARAALASAKAKRDLVLAGPRPQEVDQAHLAVIQASSSLKLAQADLDRASKLVQVGALAKRELDVAQNRFDVAKGQYDIAVQAENIALEGSRIQDVRAAEQGVAEAEASLKQANVRVAQARAIAMQAKVKAGEVESARAQVSQTSAAIRFARVALSYATVVAPFDGRIVDRMVDPGAMASPGVPLIAVEGGKYRLEAVVPEDVLSTLTVGTDAPVQIDALGHSSINGRVAEIDPQASTGTHSFVVRFDLTPTNGLRSGMFGRAKIPVAHAKGILIPASTTREREGLHYVFVVNREGVARLRIVTLGDQRGALVEVLSGLSGGERIVASDLSHVTDGDTVEAK